MAHRHRGHRSSDPNLVNSAFARGRRYAFYPEASHPTDPRVCFTVLVSAPDTLATLVILMGHCGTPIKFLLAWLALCK